MRSAYLQYRIYMKTPHTFEDHQHLQTSPSAMSMSSELAAAIEDENLHVTRHGSQPLPRPEISAFQKMISACLGSLITSFAVTPFDVVRIRMQQQEIMKTAGCCEPAAMPISGSHVAQQSKSPVFWVNRHYCNSPQTCPKISSTFQGIMSISHNEGLRALWRGLLLTLFMAVPSNIIYFTGYEYIRDHSFLQSPILNPLLCGLLARLMAATVISPVELLKTRLQSIPSDSVSGGAPLTRTKVLSSLIQDSVKMTQQQGIGLLFTGLKITLWRDVPFLGIYWLCYEFFKENLGHAMDVSFDSNAKKQDDWKVFTVSFLSGSLSGLIAAFFTNPFDVGKTRLQIQNETSLKPKQSMFRFLFQIYKNEGISALYGGFAPRVMKVVPLCAIMISSYEIGKKFFKDTV